MKESTMTSRGARRRNFYFPDSLMDEAKALADRKGVTMSTVLRTALEKYLAAVKRAETKPVES
jgi:predicted DNA-binding protein